MTDTVTTVILSGNEGSPFGVAVSPDGSKVYATNSTNSTVSVINAATDTVVGHCQVYVLGTRNGCIRYTDLPGFRPLLPA